MTDAERIAELEAQAKSVARAHAEQVATLEAELRQQDEWRTGPAEAKIAALEKQLAEAREERDKARDRWNIALQDCAAERARSEYAESIANEPCANCGFPTDDIIGAPKLIEQLAEAIARAEKAERDLAAAVLEVKAWQDAALGGYGEGMTPAKLLEEGKNAEQVLHDIFEEHEADLAAAVLAEREACAKWLLEKAEKWSDAAVREEDADRHFNATSCAGHARLAREYAAAIRARGAESKEVGSEASGTPESVQEPRQGTAHAAPPSPATGSVAPAVPTTGQPLAQNEALAAENARLIAALRSAAVALNVCQGWLIGLGRHKEAADADRWRSEAHGAASAATPGSASPEVGAGPAPPNDPKWVRERTAQLMMPADGTPDGKPYSLAQARAQAWDDSCSHGDTTAPWVTVCLDCFDARPAAEGRPQEPSKSREIDEEAWALLEELLTHQHYGAACAVCTKARDLLARRSGK